AAFADWVHRRRRIRRALFAAVAILLTIALPLGVGFLWFLLRMPIDEIALERSADGIVVLTGGSSRVQDGLELLAAKRGKRLLISGVHHGTTTGRIPGAGAGYFPPLAGLVGRGLSRLNHRG